MTAHRKSERSDVNRIRDHRPVPTHIKLFVRREHAPIECFKRGFQ
jgi:hypothetical protein